MDMALPKKGHNKPKKKKKRSGFHVVIHMHPFTSVLNLSLFLGTLWCLLR